MQQRSSDVKSDCIRSHDCTCHIRFALINSHSLLPSLNRNMALQDRLTRLATKLKLMRIDESRGLVYRHPALFLRWIDITRLSLLDSTTKHAVFGLGWSNHRQPMFPAHPAHTWQKNRDRREYSVFHVRSPSNQSDEDKRSNRRNRHVIYLFHWLSPFALCFASVSISH